MSGPAPTGPVDLPVTTTADEIAQAHQKGWVEDEDLYDEPEGEPE